MACGAAHSAAVLASGVLLLWGDNSRGQCGGGGAAGAAALGRLVATPEACGVFESEPVLVRFRVRVRVRVPTLTLTLTLT